MLFFLSISVVLCQTCTKNKIEDFDNGQFLIVGLFPMNCSRPSEIDNRSIAWIEAMKYTVEEANKLLNHSVFSYVIYDTYDPISMDMTSFAILDSFKLLETNNCSSCQKQKKLDPKYNVLGFVGPSESSTAIYTHQLTSPYKNIPIISYAAVSNDLNDQALYPNLFRMLPDDNLQAEFIIKILKKYGWTFISVVAVDSSYGRGGVEVFKKKCEKVRICLDVSEILLQAYDQIHYTNIATRLKNSNAKVIIFWGQYKPLYNLLQIAMKANVTGRTWMLTEAVGKNPFFLNYELAISNKFLFVVETMGEDEAFRNYFYSLTFRNSSQSLKTVFAKHGVDKNNMSFNAKEIKEVFDLSSVAAVQYAVKVFIESFFQYQEFYNNITLPTEQKITEPFRKIDNRTRLREIIKQISFKTADNSQSFKFNSKQNSDLIYFELYSYSKSEFSLIDRLSFNTTNLDIINNKNENLYAITSVCSNPCPPGQRKVISEILKCCWTCSPCLGNTIVENESCTKCKNDSFSNLDKTKCIEHTRIYWSFGHSQQSFQQVLTLFYSAVGVTVSLFFMFSFVKMKSTPIVRSSKYELSLLQMIMHLIWFILPLLVFEEESELKCQIRIYFGSFIHVAIITILLAKTTLLVGVFSLDIPWNKLEKTERIYIKSKSAIMLFLPPCIYISIICVAHFSSFKIDVSDVQDMTLFTVEKYCNSSRFSLIYLCFVLVLSFFCGLQSFKGRNLPSSHNECKFIAYSLLFSNIILCVIVGLVSSDLYLSGKKLAYCLLTLTSNLLLIIILFFNKVKMIWMNPEKNTRAEFNRNWFNRFNKSEFQSSINSTDSNINLVDNMHHEL